MYMSIKSFLYCNEIIIIIIIRKVRLKDVEMVEWFTNC